MEFRLEAACASNIGKIRKNNEDNILFFNKTLPENNRGLRNPTTGDATISEPMCFAVFDGMGGEDYGEIAAFTAAQTLKEELLLQSEFLVPEKQRLTDLCSAMNLVVVKQAQKLRTNRMGTTVAMLYFLPQRVYVCNLGDSRAYRLRAGEFMQLSEDHTESSTLAENMSPQKTPLTQYLGIAPDELVLNPHVAKGEILPGDVYLLCSDGLTDMLSNFEIANILYYTRSASDCVSKLIDGALEKGGKDNITVIVCKIEQ